MSHVTVCDSCHKTLDASSRAIYLDNWGGLPPDPGIYGVERISWPAAHFCGPVCASTYFTKHADRLRRALDASPSEAPP